MGNKRVSPCILNVYCHGRQTRRYFWQAKVVFYRTFHFLIRLASGGAGSKRYLAYIRKGRSRIGRGHTLALYHRYNKRFCKRQKQRHCNRINIGFGGARAINWPNNGRSVHGAPELEVDTAVECSARFIVGGSYLLQRKD